jgi:hypothetical protein
MFSDKRKSEWQFSVGLPIVGIKGKAAHLQE